MSVVDILCFVQLVLDPYIALCGQPRGELTVEFEQKSCKLRILRSFGNFANRFGALCQIHETWSTVERRPREFQRLNPMELYHNQVTRAQGSFSLRMFHRSWGIMMIQENISAPC